MALVRLKFLPKLVLKDIPVIILDEYLVKCVEMLKYGEELAANTILSECQVVWRIEGFPKYGIRKLLCRCVN